MRIGSFHSVSVLVKTTPFYKTLSHYDQSQIVVVAGYWLACGLTKSQPEEKPNSQTNVDAKQWRVDRRVAGGGNKGRQAGAGLTQSPLARHPPTGESSPSWSHLISLGLGRPNMEYPGFQPASRAAFIDSFHEVIKYSSVWYITGNGILWFWISSHSILTAGLQMYFSWPQHDRFTDKIRTEYFPSLGYFIWPYYSS